MIDVAIRHSNDGDLARIRALHAEAFGEPEGATVAQLAVDIIGDPSAAPCVSLVAEQRGNILGSIVFSPVSVEGVNDNRCYILAPLAVAPRLHGQGLGSQLIETGLQRLRGRGVEVVLVLGDPNYYSRAGFHHHHDLQAPYPVPFTEAWMALELTPDALQRTSGRVDCCEPLMAPEHW